MKRIICAAMLILPAVAFFIEDYGEYTVGLRIFGVFLILLVFIDFVFKKNIVVPACKILYFTGYVPWLIYKRRKERKRRRRLEQSQNFLDDIFWYI